jgi:hypothetical protein
VIERHEDDDQPAQGVGGKETLASWFLHLLCSSVLDAVVLRPG